MHKRTRILFDDVLANAVKKGQEDGNIGGRLLSLDGGGIKGLPCFDSNSIQILARNFKSEKNFILDFAVKQD